MTGSKIRSLFICIILMFVTQACSNSDSSSSNPSTTGSVVETAEPSETSEAQPSASTESTTPVMEYDTETLQNTTGKTLIRSITTKGEGIYHASFAIVSAAGTVAIMDPNAIEKKGGKTLHADIITVSHSHADHLDFDFIGASDAKTSISKQDSFTVKDIQVTSIAASHTEEMLPDPSDYIYIFEVDGIRIAHFGDLGQAELTPDQLTAIGKIDILLTRFSNAEAYGASTAKTIKVLQQIKPIIVTPTHYEPEVIQEVMTKETLIDKGDVKELALNRADLDAIKGTEYYFLSY